MTSSILQQMNLKLLHSSSMLGEAISPRADGDDVITVKDDNTASKFALDISN